MAMDKDTLSLGDVFTENQNENLLNFHMMDYEDWDRYSVDRQFHWQRLVDPYYKLIDPTNPQPKCRRRKL